MDTKIATLKHLRNVSNTIKQFVNNLIVEVKQSTASAIEEVEDKIDSIAEGKIIIIKDKATNENYTLSMENGLLYLDDWKGEDE